ncbi:MAG TPA: 4'-phosphopantetheinyl transferase superfamily protein [Gemmatimonadaceae bacterium]|jgi:4'-phosphopantetheinyl transferase
MYLDSAVSVLSELQAFDVRARVFDVSETDAASDIALLSAEERSRASKFQRISDRVSFVAARAELRRNIGAELGMPAERVPIGVSLHGRPTLPAGMADVLDFNVTHSTSRVAIALSRGRRVGIDIESVLALRDLDLLIQEVMGPRERNRLASLSGMARTRAFYECWTRKEALVKAMGEGIRYPVASIDLPILPVDGRVALPEAEMQVANGRSWLVWTTWLSEEFVLSIAVGE